MNHDGITVTAMLLLAAFAVDRLASAATFLASRPGDKEVTPNERQKKEWKSKILYFVVAAIIALVILSATDKIRLLEAMGMLKEQVTGWDQWIDRALTFLVLVGGAERISNLLGSPLPANGQDEQTPVKLEGTIIVDSASAKTKGANV